MIIRVACAHLVCDLIRVLLINLNGKLQILYFIGILKRNRKFSETLSL